MLLSVLHDNLQRNFTLIINLTGQTTIKTSTGSGSASDLKTGDGVTIVEEPNPDRNNWFDLQWNRSKTQPEQYNGLQ